MKRPTEFVPVYDQSKRQAAEMMEALFVELEKANGLLDEVQKWFDLDGQEWGNQREHLRGILAKRGGVK